MTASTPRATARPGVGRATPTIAPKLNRRWSYLVIAAIAVGVPGWLLTRPDSRVATELEFTGSPQTYVVPAGICRLRVDLVGGAGGQGGTAGTPGAGAEAVAVVAVTPGETLRVRVGGWGGEAVGSTPGAGGWNGGGDGGKALGNRTDGPGKAGGGGGGATDIRQGGDGLEHRIIVAAGGAGGAGGGIGGPLGIGRRRRRRPHRARRRCAARDCEPGDGWKGRDPDDGRRPRPERLGPRGHGDGRRARARRRRRLGRRERRRRRRRRALRRRGRGRQRLLQRRPRWRRLGIRPRGNDLPGRRRRRRRSSADLVRPRPRRRAPDDELSSTGERATRKPMWAERRPGELRLRIAQRR